MRSVGPSRETRHNAHEVKFVVDAEIGERVRERARALLAPDPWASGPDSDQYLTTTLYFDTTDFAVYNRRGSFRRAKYRVRRYGDGNVVFVERKLRTTGLLVKRRTSIGIEDLPLLTATEPDAAWSGRWFHQRLQMRRLSAVCQVSYRRTARVALTDHGPIRLTLDDELLGLPVGTPAFAPTDEARSLGAGIIVEMKFHAIMPAVFKQIIEEFALEPARISKYRLAIGATRPAVASVSSTAAGTLEESCA